MENQSTHLFINWILVEPKEILVGATDNDRWEWDTKAGDSGADAKTIVYVTITEHGKKYAPSENAGFHCSPGDPDRPLAMAYIADLFDIAWEIRNQKLDWEEARKRYFGMRIPKI